LGQIGWAKNRSARCSKIAKVFQITNGCFVASAKASLIAEGTDLADENFTT
jgi:hypothetical protein